MSETTNYGLFVSNDDQMTFREWRLKLSGETDSNMTKIDAALGEMQGRLENVVQADFEENNPKSPAYIQNRTHWKEVEIGAVLFEKSDLTSVAYYLPNEIGLEEGQRYDVTYMGTTSDYFYDTKPVPYVSDVDNSVRGLILVLDDGNIRNQKTTGLPFAFVEYDVATVAVKGVYGFVIQQDGSATASLTIGGHRTTWHKLERGYLPDDLGDVKSVNGARPDEAGNVSVDVGVKTINGKTPDEYGNVKIDTGGGATVQADFGENDSTAAGYIHNRTHWKEIVGVDGEVIPKTTLPFLSGSSYTPATTASYELLEGVGYVVTWKGQAYECVGQSLDGAVCLGNLKFADASAEESDYPFCIKYLDGKCTYYDGLTSGMRSATVKVDGNPEIIYHKLDRNYLPDDLGGVTDYNKLENRPVYTYIVFEDILPETAVKINAENGKGHLPDIVDVQAGKTYTVKWNGTDYICTAQLVETEPPVVALGDVGLMAGGQSTGEPFAILCFSPEYAANLGVGISIEPLDGLTSVTMAIQGEVEKVKKLDSKYLPDDLGGGDQAFVVHFSGDDIGSLRADATLDDIGQAIEDRKVVYAQWEGTIHIPLVAFEFDTAARFSLLVSTPDEPATSALLFELDLSVTGEVTAKPTFLTSGGVFIVTMQTVIPEGTTEGYLHTDSTLEDVEQAFAEGKMVFAQVETYLLPLTSWIPGSEAVFSGVLSADGGNDVVNISIRLDSSGELTPSTSVLPTAEYTDSTYVRVDAYQDLTDKQKAQARTNIGVVGKAGSGENSTVFNNYDLNIASGGYSHAEGSGTTASGDYSHAQGISTKATGKSENVIGEFNLYAETVYVQEYTLGSAPQAMYRPDYQLGIATGFDIHENGREFVLSGVEYRTAENVDIGDYVFYEDAQQVTTVHRVDEVWHDTAVYFVYTSFKLVNKSSDRGEYAHIVGNGISEDTRSNAHTLDWNGNAWFAGDVYVKSTSGKNRDNGSLRLVTTEDLAEVASASGSVVWGSF